MSAQPAPVLITGATGFIGQHLHRHLLNTGYPVCALVRPQSVPRAGLDSRCEVVGAELTDADAISRALGGVGCVVYAAGAVRGRCFDDFRSANVSGLQALVGVLGREAPCRRPRVILLSSLAAGRPELSDYARSKRCGEQVLEQASGVDWSILRPPAVYGPGDKELRGLFSLARRGIALRPGPPGQRLALLHVDDLVRAVAACLSHPDACRHGCYELDDGKPGGYDFDEIGEALAGRPVHQVGVPPRLLQALATWNRWLASRFGYLPMLTPGKVRELQQAGWLCDNSPFSRATGWRPAIELSQGAAGLFR